jgi:hypothetical protein
VYKAQNYPVYYATYLEDIQSWSRILPDGDLAPGDTLDRTLIQHSSVEWPELILKSGSIPTDDVGLLGLPGLPVLSLSPYYGAEVDVVIDGKSVSFLDSTYTNEYTKISERLAGGGSHWDTYFTRDYDYSYAVRKAYSIDTGINYDSAGTGSPGAFKILYELIVEEADTIDLMIEDNHAPIYPVNPPAVITDAIIAADAPIGFTINLEILGKKETATGVGAEESLLSLSISPWKELIAASKRGIFARGAGGAVNTDVINWILKYAPDLPGAAAEAGNNVRYDSLDALPVAVQTAINATATPTP